MKKNYPKYFELVKLNRNRVSDKTNLEVSILSNLTVNYLKEVLDYQLNNEKPSFNIKLGDYDNIVQDSFNNKSDFCIIFLDLSNYFDGIHYKIDLYDEFQLNELFEKITNDIYLITNNLKNKKKVFINKFTSSPFFNELIYKSNMEILASRLNEFLDRLDIDNLYLIEINKIFMELSLEKSISYRDFYSSKSLYTIDFFISYCKRISYVFNYLNGKISKSLILDCDNSLWSGVIGEDGMDGVKMSSKNTKGVFFNEVQYLCKILINKGVIFGLCSKNNYEDVQNVIDNHTDFLINNDDIVIKKVNWIDKASNLMEISKELNIGIDSLVFVDDSDFEINLVNDIIPNIKTFQVSKSLYNYPIEFRKLFNYFYNPNYTKEDKLKSQQYKSQIQRSKQKKLHNNIDEYLESLEIEINILINQESIIDRMSQMTLKTNQFNLTTKRYTTAEITSFLNNNFVFALSVKDKFGNSGVTGLAIVTIKNNIAFIDSLLLSCRIIGRKIEEEFLGNILLKLQSLGVDTVQAQYIKSPKNDLVKNFYEKMHFNRISSNNNKTKYSMNLKKYDKQTVKFIKTKINGK